MSSGRLTKVKDGGTYEQYDYLNPPQTKENDSKKRQMDEDKAKMDAQTKEIDMMKRQLEENKVEQTKEKEEMKRKMEEKENEIEKRVKDRPKVKDGGTYEHYDSLNPPGQPVEEGEGNKEEGGPVYPFFPSSNGAMTGASVQGVGDNGGIAGGGGDGGKKWKSIFGGIGKKDKKKELEKLGKKELRERIHMLEEEREEREAKGREMEANLKRQVEENKAKIVEQTKEKNRLLDEDKAKVDAQTKEIEEGVCLFGISFEAKEKIGNFESENRRLENKIRNLEHQLTLKVRAVISIIII